MKVLHLLSSGGFFGAENVVAGLVSEQIQRGTDAYLGLFKNTKNPHLELAEVAGKFNLPMQIFDCRSQFDLKTIFGIKNFIIKQDFKIVHSHGYKSNFYAFFATFNTGVKRIATCHNWLRLNIKMKFYEFLDKALLKQFDRVVAVSDALKEEILKSGVPQDKVIVINNGVDVDRLQVSGCRSQVKQSLGIREVDKVIGAVGRLTPEKGHSYLLGAFKRVVCEFPDTKLLIVGEGPLRESLESGVRSQELEGKVIFAGMRNDIPEILSIIDIFVMPSLKEGMPMALLEAMAAKKPIIASRVGAIPKVIEDGRSGLLVEPKDIGQLAEAILALLKNKEKAESVSQNAYAKVKNEFSAEKMAQDYTSIYNDVLNIKRGS